MWTALHEAGDLPVDLPRLGGTRASHSRLVTPFNGAASSQMHVAGAELRRGRSRDNLDLHTTPSPADTSRLSLFLRTI